MNIINRLTKINKFSSNAKRFFSVLVPNRYFLQIEGKDSKNFLQGLITNDINRLTNHGDSLAACFLNTKGRIFANTFIYRLAEADCPPEIDSYIIETHSENGEKLKSHLNLYKLRSKVKISSQPYSLILDPNCKNSQLQKEKYPEGQVVIASADPRVYKYGTRVIKNQSEDQTDSELTEKSYEGDDHEKRWIECRDMLLGIPEGPEINGLIPFEVNLDMLNYFNFSKGCYIGQELSARTKFKGVIRKRLFPFLVTTNDSDPNSPLNEKISSKLRDVILTCTWQGECFGKQLPKCNKVFRGMKVFKKIETTTEGESDEDLYEKYSQEKPIGEIIKTNKEGTYGLVLLSLDAVNSLKGDLIVLDIPHSDDEDQEGEKKKKQEEIQVSDKKIKYIKSFIPDWFRPLNPKNGQPE